MTQGDFVNIFIHLTAFFAIFSMIMGVLAIYRGKD